MAPEECPVEVLWDDRFLAYDFGPDHPFTERSRGLAVELLEDSGFFETPSHTRGRSFEPAARATLERFHERAYVARVERVSLSTRRTLLDSGDTPSFPGCFEASARLVEASVHALDRVVESPTRHLLQPGGGLHHAHPDRASGFCVFNDVGVLLRTAFDRHSLRRVAYLDIDAHHGDGVMYGFFDDGRLLDIDFHQDGRTLFPGTGSEHEVGVRDGTGLKVNVPLPPGAGDRSFLEAFRRTVPTMLRSYRPELIVLQSGVDGHAGDPLAQLRYSTPAYADVLAIVHALAHEVCGGRLVVTGGGGYRAESVARVLAQDAYVLTDRSGGAGARSGPLPERWRSTFRERVGREAPARWETDAPVPEAPEAVGVTSGVLETLERELGRPLRLDA